VDGGELDSKGRIGKDQLARIAHKHAHHFSDSGDKTTLNLFSQNPWFLGRLLPITDKFNTRRLIDLQADLIGAFEKLLAQPKEDQPGILKDLAIRTLSHFS
jgi:DNA polymerase-3 subunit delta